MRGGIKALKHNVRTTLQLSYHECKYLTHTSKTAHVQRTQMLVTVRFTIRVTSLHRWNKQGIKSVIDSLLITPVEWSYLNTDMRKFETSQKEESRAQSADSSKTYRKPSRAFNCSRFACCLLFQTGKNRMQLNCRVKRCGVKNQHSRQKVLSGDLNFRKGAWPPENLIKASLICSVSYLHLERLSSLMPTVATGLV